MGIRTLILPGMMMLLFLLLGCTAGGPPSPIERRGCSHRTGRSPGRPEGNAGADRVGRTATTRRL
ncbi:MAG: hypothetical protein MPW13_20465 [Candidatus Manganitrophus sp.]|nr:hypothetical protein [Candidatus Manganitrophus sp.]